MPNLPYDQVSRLDPPTGMDREVGLMFAQLELCRRKTRDSIAGLSLTQLDASLPHLPNTIGRLIAHLAAAEFHWIHRIVLGENGITSLNPTWNEPTLDSASYASAKGHDIAYYLALLDEARAKTEAVCWKLKDEDLELWRDVKHRGPGHRCTIRYALWLIQDHEAHHRGQIESLLGALERSAKR